MGSGRCPTIGESRVSGICIHYYITTSRSSLALSNPSSLPQRSLLYPGTLDFSLRYHVYLAGGIPTITSLLGYSGTFVAVGEGWGG